jgi:quercetin dioxygenase-like cupin family protein
MTALVEVRSQEGYTLARDEGEAFWLLGMLQTVKIGRADTGGQFGMIEFILPPGLGSPWHVHPEEGEWFYVVEGNLTLYVGDARFDLAAGGFAFGPKGVPHTFIGAGPGPARALVGFAPMQFEGFLREVGQVAPARVLPPPPAGPPPELERLAPIAKRSARNKPNPTTRNATSTACARGPIGMTRVRPRCAVLCLESCCEKL